MSDLFTHGYALLIGVGNTVASGYSLPVTVKDAQALKAVLTDANLCAYPNSPDHIRLLENQGATRSAILDGLDWLKGCAEADPDATIVIYYSGHGMVELDSSAYYLFQHDFDPQAIPETALSAQTLSEKLGKINAKRLWVIIDSCHAEGMASAKDLPTDFVPTALPKGVVNALKQGEGRAVFTSSRGNQSSFVRPDKILSLYTYHLIEALKGAANQPGDRVVTLSNIMTHLGKTVEESARNLQEKQTPFFDTATEDFPVAMLCGGKGLPSQIQSSEVPRVMTNQEVMTPALAMAKRSLAILEEQAAGFGRLEIPGHLQIQREEKRQEVAELEARLRDGKSNG